MNNLMFAIFLISLPVTIYFLVRVVLALVKKDRVRQMKQLKFAGVTAAVMIVSFIAFIATAEPVEEKAEETPVEEEPIVEEPEVEEDPVVEEPKKEVVAPVEVEKPKEKPKEEKPVVKEEIKEPEEVASEWDDLKEKDNLVGKSDKDFKGMSDAKPSKVRNDSTGKWRITKIAESIPIEEYALSYSDLYMNEDEVHFIVNFNYNTTTWLNKMGGLLFVEVREYVKREEHDANVLGSGMTLKSYTIYPDGDIEEMES